MNVAAHGLLDYAGSHWERLVPIDGLLALYMSTVKVGIGCASSSTTAG